MALKPGCKQLGFGTLPAEWKREELGAHARFRTGPFGSALHKSDYTTDGVPVVNPMHIIDGALVPTSTMTITEVAAKALGDFRLRSGDIVIGRRGEMGRCAVVRENEAGWLCGTGSMIVRCADSLIPDFLQRVLSSSQVVAAIEDSSVGSTMINLNQGVLARLKVQVPPPSEQRAIAAALSDVDALIGSLERLIAKKRDLKQAVMQQLLSGQTRLSGFSGGWPVSTVGREFEIQLGKMLDAEKNTGLAKPYLGNKAVQWGRIVLSDLKTMAMSAADLERYRLQRGDLLVCEGGEVGRAAIWEAPIEECYYQKALHRLRPVRGFNTYFMLMLLRYWVDHGLLDNYVSQTSIAHLTREKLAEVPLPVPAPAEQAAIAAVLSDMDAEIVVLEQRRDKAWLLKQGMMQELLTGRTRLV